MSFTFITIYSLGQNKTDLYVTNSGDTIKVGDKIKIGLGTKPDGTFKFIDGIITPGADYAGMIMIVKTIQKRGNEKIGFRYYLRLHPGKGVVNYDVSIENALKVGEIELLKKN